MANEISHGACIPQAHMSGWADFSFAQGFDAFLALPMASVPSDCYGVQREEALRVGNHLKRYCGFTHVYNAADAIYSETRFDRPEISIQMALAAMRVSRLLVMLYTVDRPSSILVEAGCALAQGIPSMYFVRKPLRLPFLLEAAHAALPSVRHFEYDCIEDVLHFIESEGSAVLRTLAGRKRS